MYYTQDQYTSSDCDLIPHYTNTTDGVTVVSFTSATHDSAIITIQQDGHITVSTDNYNNVDAIQFRFIHTVVTETTGDNNDTQFGIYKKVSIMYLIIVLIIVANLSVYKISDLAFVV